MSPLTASSQKRTTDRTGVESSGPVRVQRDESGASLILALAFLLAAALIVVAVASASSNDLLNSSNLKNQRSLEYAADGVATLAVQSVRYSGNTYLGPPTSCLPPNVPAIDGVSLFVFCSAQTVDPISSLTRVINFYVCTTSVPCSTPGSPGPTTTSAAPANKLILQAQVIFDDYSLDKTYLCDPSKGTISTCGSSMTISSWVQQTASH